MAVETQEPEFRVSIDPEDKERMGRAAEHARRFREARTAKPSDPPYRVPDKGEFGGAEFLPADDLRAIAREVVEQHPDRFEFLAPYEVCFLWRAKGGASGGVATLGKTTKASGLVRYFGEQDLVVWLAADHCRDLALSRRQIEALLWHELSHPQLDPESGQLIIRGHEFSGFLSELEEYGPWMADLELMVKTARQLELDLDGSDDEAGPNGG